MVPLGREEGEPDAGNLAEGQLALPVAVHAARLTVLNNECAWGSMDQCLGIGLPSDAPSALTHPRRGSSVPSWWVAASTCACRTSRFTGTLHLRTWLTARPCSP